MRRIALAWFVALVVALGFPAASLWAAGPHGPETSKTGQSVGGRPGGKTSVTQPTRGLASGEAAPRGYAGHSGFTAPQTAAPPASPASMERVAGRGAAGGEQELLEKPERFPIRGVTPSVALPPPPVPVAPAVVNIPITVETPARPAPVAAPAAGSRETSGGVALVPARSPQTTAVLLVPPPLGHPISVRTTPTELRQPRQTASAPAIAIETTQVRAPAAETSRALRVVTPPSQASQPTTAAAGTSQSRTSGAGRTAHAVASAPSMSVAPAVETRPAPEPVAAASFGSMPRAARALPAADVLLAAPRAATLDVGRAGIKLVHSAGRVPAALGDIARHALAVPHPEAVPAAHRAEAGAPASLVDEAASAGPGNVATPISSEESDSGSLAGASGHGGTSFAADLAMFFLFCTFLLCLRRQMPSLLRPPCMTYAPPVPPG